MKLKRALNEEWLNSRNLDKYKESINHSHVW